MRIWQRLLWKEFRESSPFVLIGVVLPLLCLAFSKFRGEIIGLPICIVIVTVAVWASARAQEKRDGGLPISVPQRLASRFLLLILGVIPVGLSLGCLTAFRLDEAVQLDMIPLTLGVCVLVAVFCTVISSVYALIPAVVAGVLLALVSFTTFHSPELFWVQLRILFAVLVFAVFWDGYRGKRRVLIGRIALPVLLALAVFWGVIGDGETGDMPHSSSQSPSTAPRIAVGNFFYSDGTLSLDYDRSRQETICLLDRRIPRRYFIAPERIAPPGDYLRSLTCLDRRVVLFAVQAPKDAQVRVVAWDVHTGQVAERFRFTGWRGMMAGYCYTSHSPDNHYLLLGGDSKIGQGDDFWLLDLQRNHATMVAANAERGRYNDNRDAALREAIWTPDRLILRLEMRSLIVDLRTLRVAPLQLAACRPPAGGGFGKGVYFLGEAVECGADAEAVCQAGEPSVHARIST
ncbi:MAG TPA: hypothetical protein VGL77_07005, partial [Armatimonadota bacterium]